MRAPAPSVVLPADVDEKFAQGRQGIFRNLPFPVRDAASMSLAENQIWAGLDKLERETCLPLFADYVDLLSGMVLRDTHLDDAICEIIDD